MLVGPNENRALKGRFSIDVSSLLLEIELFLLLDVLLLFLAVSGRRGRVAGLSGHGRVMDSLVEVFCLGTVKLWREKVKAHNMLNLSNG